MQNIEFPVNFKFNIGTLANDFTATDAKGETIAYVRQKMFKLKEDIVIYQDENKSKVLFKIKADKWIDFSAAYKFMNENEEEIGKVARKGWKSLWKANYDVVDHAEQIDHSITEEKGWVKVADAILGEIPVLGALTGYMFNPSYVVKNTAEEPVLRLKKMPSFFGRKFEVSKINDHKEEDQARIMLSLMMMILLERRRG